jgi:hypothetical protein
VPVNAYKLCTWPSKQAVAGSDCDHVSGPTAVPTPSARHLRAAVTVPSETASDANSRCAKLKLPVRCAAEALQHRMKRSSNPPSCTSCTQRMMVTDARRLDGCPSSRAVMRARPPSSAVAGSWHLLLRLDPTTGTASSMGTIARESCPNVEQTCMVYRLHLLIQYSRLTSG